LTNQIFRYSIPRFYTIHDLAKGLFNDLEQVSIRIHPVLAELKRVLIEHGALGALMSGSGPTVFGIFETEEMAVTAEKALSEMDNWSVFSATAL
jgi:4-diphosphocytidyl-2-C-methyl-D-erythritol kinase